MRGLGQIVFQMGLEHILIIIQNGNMKAYGKKENKMERESKHSKMARCTKDNFKMASDTDMENLKIMMVHKLMVLFSKDKYMDLQMLKISHIPIQDSGGKGKWMALEKANGVNNNKKYNILESTN